MSFWPDIFAPRQTAPIPIGPGDVAAAGPRPSAMLRRLMLVLLSVGLLGYAFSSVDLGAAARAAAGVGPGHLGLAIIFLIVNLLLSSLRFRSVLAGAGHKLTVSVAVRINIASQIGALFVVQLVGHIASRAFLLKPYGLTPTRVAALTIYEKVYSLGVCLIFLIAGLCYLFGFGAWEWIAAMFGGISPLAIVAVIGLGALACYWLFPLLVRLRLVNQVGRGQQVSDMLTALVLTLGSQACMVAAYVTVCSGLRPDVPTLAAAAATSVVMYLAAMPITSGGWGIREVSSIHLLGLIGFDAASALAASVLTGLLGLVVLGLVAAGVWLVAALQVRRQP